jgi:hypothetical protein
VKQLSILLVLRFTTINAQAVAGKEADSLKNQSG